MSSATVRRAICRRCQSGLPANDCLPTYRKRTWAGSQPDSPQRAPPQKGPSFLFWFTALLRRADTRSYNITFLAIQRKKRQPGAFCQAVPFVKKKNPKCVASGKRRCRPVCARCAGSARRKYVPVTVRPCPTCRPPRRPDRLMDRALKLRVHEQELLVAPDRHPHLRARFQAARLCPPARRK